MMWWNGFGWGWGGLAILGMIMCVAMMAMMAMMMSHGSSRRTREPGETNVDAPERILAKRLASGEIDVEEYQRLRDTLQRTGNATPGTADPSSADRHSPTA